MVILLYVTTFLLPSASIAHAAAARVQTVAAANAGTSLVSATWPSATTSGDLLVAIVTFEAGTGTSVTPPAGGWILAVRSDSGTKIGTAIYYIANAASQSGASTWTFTVNTKATLTLVEYSGITISSPLDKTASVIGKSTTGDSGLTASTVQANELAVAVIAVQDGTATFSGQTNGFTEVSEIFSSMNATVFEEKILSAMGTQQVQVTIPISKDWAGAIATFKAAPVTIFEQSAFRLFNNSNSTDVGTALVAQDTPASLGVDGDTFRLRLLLHIGGSNLGVNGETFKLQFAERSGTCDTTFSGETYTDVTSLTSIAYNDNSTPLDGDNLTANASDPAHGIDTVVNQDYEEGNTFTNSAAEINLDQDGKWDFSLIDNDGAASKNYCFRVVKSDSSLLDAYIVIPEVTTATADTIPPTVTEVTPVTTPTNDTTPNYTFNTDEAGIITYGGDCSSATTSAVLGNNTITLNTLTDGTHSNCTLIVTDSVGNVSSTLNISSFSIDTTAPTLSEITQVVTPTNDTTPNYTFNTDEAGDITYSGSCSSATTTAVSGNNTITFNTLTDGTYSDCTIAVTDTTGNASPALNVSSFMIDATAPTGAGNSSPANTSIDIPLTQTLIATTAADAHTIEYYFEIAEDNLFTIAVQNSGWQSGTTWNPSLSKSETYYWHVKAHDSLGNESGFGTTFGFTAISGYTFANISTSISLVDETDLTTEFTDGTYSGVETVVVKDAEGYVVGKFVIDFSTALSEIDMTGLIADTDFTQYKSVLHDSNWPTEVYSSKTLYIPSTGAGSVYICPGATSLAEVTSSCVDKVEISVGQTVSGMTVSTTTIDGQEYYVVSGISGTGGGEVPPPPPSPQPSPSGGGGAVSLFILAPTITPEEEPTPIPTEPTIETKTAPEITTDITESEPLITLTLEVEPELIPTLSSAFNRNLGLGDSGLDVQVLQQFLNQSGFILAETGPGSPGSETNYFGTLTKAALIQYQQAYGDYILAPLGLSSGTGFFGSSTRTFITSTSSLDPAFSVGSLPEPTESTIPAPTLLSITVFTRNLGIGDSGLDVQALQQFLNQKGFTVAEEGPGSPGDETKEFGPLTGAALARFQEASAAQILAPLGLTSGTGFFGPRTMEYINSLLSI